MLVWSYLVFCIRFNSESAPATAMSSAIFAILDLSIAVLVVLCLRFTLNIHMRSQIAQQFLREPHTQTLEHWPAVTVITQGTTYTQITYPGPVEYVLVMPSESVVDRMPPPPLAIARSLSAPSLLTSDRKEALLKVVASHVPEQASQRLANMIRGANSGNPTTKYLYFVNSDCETDARTLQDMVFELESQSEIFACTGCPLDVPAQGATLWTWVSCQARYLSRLVLFPCEPHKIWGGSVMIRRSDFASVAQSSYYSEDAAFERVANERDASVLNSPDALFPIACRHKTVDDCWRVVNREALRVWNAHSAASLLIDALSLLTQLCTSLLCVSGFFLSLVVFAVTVMEPSSYRHYPYFVHASLHWLFWVVMNAFLEKKMLQSAFKLSQVTTEREIPEMCQLSLFKLALSHLLLHGFRICALLGTITTTYTNAKGSTYRLCCGRILSQRLRGELVEEEGEGEEGEEPQYNEPKSPMANNKTASSCSLIFMQVGILLVAVLMVTYAFRMEAVEAILPDNSPSIEDWQLPEFEEGALRRKDMIPYLPDGPSLGRKNCLLETPELNGTVTVGGGKVFEIPIPVKKGTGVSWEWSTGDLEDAEEAPTSSSTTHTEIAFSVRVYDSVKKTVKTIVEPGKKTSISEYKAGKSEVGILALEWNNKFELSAKNVSYYLKVVQPSTSISTRSAHEQMSDIPVFVISMPQSTLRREIVTERMAKFNVTRYVFEDAVDGAEWEKVDKGQFRCKTQPLFVKVKDKKMPPSNAVTDRLGPTIATHEVAVTISHLKTIRAAYVSGLPFALVVEDDISLEYLPSWGDNGIDTVMDALEGVCATPAHRNWTVVQVAITVGFLKSSLVKKLEQRLSSLEPVSLRHPHQDKDLWSATAYLIHRRGMEYLLERHWPGGLAGVNTEWANLQGVFDLSEAQTGVADWIVYTAPNTFVANRPLFSYDDNGVSTLSATRKDAFFALNFNPADRSKMLLAKTFFTNKRRTFHGDRYQFCKMDIGFLPDVPASFLCGTYMWVRATLELLTVLLLIMPENVLCFVRWLVGVAKSFKQLLATSCVRLVRARHNSKFR